MKRRPTRLNAPRMRGSGDWLFGMLLLGAIFALIFGLAALFTR